MSAARAFFGTAVIGFERALVYRGNYVVSVAAGLVPLLAQLLFWSAVYGGPQGRIAGYDLRQMVTYFALVYVLQWGVAATSVELQLRDDVKSGGMSFHLLRPYDYLVTRFVMSTSGRFLTFSMSLVAFLALLWLAGIGIEAPAGAVRVLALVPASVLAYALAYLMSCLVGVVSFWTLEIATFSVLVRGVMLVMSGAVFPLDYIGGTGGAVLRHLPFAYLVYFPVTIYMRPLTAAQIAGGFAVAAGWIAVLGLLLKALWESGLRRYAAYGG